MANRGTRKGYSGQKPQGNGYYRGAGGRPVDNERRRKRRRKRIMKALIAWAVCILLVGLIAVGTVRVVSSVASSKKRQFRQDGIEKLVSGDYTGAIEAFDTALEKSGKKSDGFNSDVLGYRAEAEYKLRDYEAAVHTYGLLLEMKPDTAVYLYAQSMCYAHLGDTDNAIDRYHAGNAVQKEDKDEAGRQEALFAAGGACVDAGEYEKAMGLYQDAIREGVKHGQVYNQMGLCQMAEKDYQGALDSFNQGYETFVTGHSLGSGAEPAQAAAALNADARADMALLKELVYNRAVAYEYLNQYQKALGLFEDYVSVFGPNEDAEHEIAFLKTR